MNKREKENCFNKAIKDINDYAVKYGCSIQEATEDWLMEVPAADWLIEKLTDWAKS